MNFSSRYEWKTGMNVCTVKSSSIFTQNIKVNVPKSSREVKHGYSIVSHVPWVHKARFLKRRTVELTDLIPEL